MAQQTFSAQDGWQKFEVPKGVDRVTVDLQGAGAGSVPGGRVKGQIRVKANDVLFILVGTSGKAPSGRQGGAGGTGGGGAGGDGSTGQNGGRGGGGAAAIRLNSKDGTIKAVAGGAGGRSGDSGFGGEGGAATGGHGTTATEAPGVVSNATGGTQAQGGNGGVTSAASGMNGHGATNKGLGTGGAGGQRTTVKSHGGGGGGGGYRAGGGGAAALVGVSPGGGGGGGSNFTGGLFTGVSSGQGTGGTGDASVLISWNPPPPADQPPSPPSDVLINGKPKSPNFGTKSTGRVTISAILHKQPPPQQHGSTAIAAPLFPVRMLLRYSTSPNFTRIVREESDYVKDAHRATITLTGLTRNTHYYGRLYAQDYLGKISTTYSAVDFWTNRPPTEPVLQAPSDNGLINSVDTITFDWAHKDPDPSDGQSAYEWRFRRAGTGTEVVGLWQSRTAVTSFDNLAITAGIFRAGSYYEWTVRTRDQQGAWGPFALPRSFFVLGTTNPPVLISPSKGHAVPVNIPVFLKWRFRDPSSGQAQTKADYRYRVVGTEDWITVVGGTTVPGATGQWEVPINTFVSGQHYEWAVRTYHTGDTIPSDWSDTETFWAFGGLGSQAGADPLGETIDQGNLGIGTHRAFIYERGGQKLVGEVTPLVSSSWSRVRDDIGEAKIITNGFGPDCGALLARVHTWIHELVIFRDNVRVFEGPITLIEDSVDGFTITANDVMRYVYRRIMQQGYNDSYHLVNGVAEGLITVVERAGLIISDALARNDPNVLPYVTLLSYPDDARESRSVPDYAKTAWEEVDDMAANAGLDYSIIGRRIILNDTHRPVGRLPEFRSHYFTDPPKISEYGMQLADYYASTNNAGVWGAVQHKGSPYGGVEILASSFSENGVGDGEVMTKAKLASLQKVLVEQAQRGISSRYPAPYVVRVPDNSQLSPDIPIGINQLVPGVWIPLRASGTVIEISQWQKLDEVLVTENAQDGEQVQVTMSPAPNSGQDPDADDAAAQEAQ